MPQISSVKIKKEVSNKNITQKRGQKKVRWTFKLLNFNFSFIFAVSLQLQHWYSFVHVGYSDVAMGSSIITVIFLEATATAMTNILGA